MGAEVADGDVECKKAVRRQVGAGADWIKVKDESIQYQLGERWAYVHLMSRIRSTQVSEDVT